MYSSTHRISLQNGANDCGYLFRSKEERLLFIIPYAHARVQCFSIFAFTSSPFWCKVLSKCELRVKASPFFLHRFFAMEVAQCVVFQVVAVKVKAGFAFTRNRLIYSLLRGEVKGEGKNGKIAESASAYIRVGACPARRVKGILCGVGRLEIKQGRESRKVGTFGEKVGLYFSNGVGEGENNACFPLFPRLQKSK